MLPRLGATLHRRVTRRVWRVGVAVALVGALLGPDAVAYAQTAPFCPSGQGPRLQMGFAALQAQIGAPGGTPTECEHYDGAGNAHQKTTTGAFFWRKSTGTVVFNAGNRHWALTDRGAVTWTGLSLDPPAEALAGPRATHGDVIEANADRMIEDGRRIFRYDTFGSEAFWGGQLRLHEGLAGQALGGVGPGVSPKTALAVGLKVDMEALPAPLVAQIQAGQVNLDDPATTAALLQLNAVVGVTGFFDGQGRLASVGIQCALCHSTVDDAFMPGVGRRLDGWPNRDLNVGAIVALSPDLGAVNRLLGVDDATTRKVLAAWGPGRFDAQLVLDGKGFRPDGKTAATLIPAAFGLAGVNQHNSTGSWGTVTYWNAFVANLEMHGQGTFFDPRLMDANKYPVAARAGLGNVRSPNDRITAQLAALHFYQLAIPAPAAPEGSFDPAAAARGQALFAGKAQCATCHVPPLYTEPGWNLRTPEEIGIDDFQAKRAPDNRYRTAPLRGLWAHSKGGFYHDGRFATLRDVVNHYNAFKQLGLTDQEANDVVEFLKSL
jgi:hypothetical protein